MSTRGLLKSMVVIASAQFLSIIIRLVRAKLIAVLLGPSGTGLLAVFANLQMLGSQTAGLGLTQSGVREMAAARADPAVVARLRRVLVVTLALQGGIAMAVIWLMREPLSRWLLGEVQHATEIGLVGVAVLLSLLAGSQRTLLQGMRRIGDLGRVVVLGTLAGAAAGIAAVLVMGRDGLIWFILAEPLGAILVALVYVRRLPLPAVGWPPAGEIWRRWRPMVRLGLAFMLGALATTATLLLVRTMITRDLGLDAAGQFAAAWTITITYVGFLLQAMGTDYFPRLSEIIHDRDAAARLMNDQMQLVLALGGPILLLMIGLAPWAIRLLYSAEFAEAAALLQWQMAGNVLKISSWAIGISFVAAARSGVFLYLQAQFNVFFLGAILLGLPALGIEAAGIGFLLAYVVHVAVVAALARRLHGFRWQAGTLRLFAIHGGLALALLALARAAPLAGAAAALLLAAATALSGVRGVIVRIGPHGRLVSRLARFYEMIGWPVRDGS